MEYSILESSNRTEIMKLINAAATNWWRLHSLTTDRNGRFFAIMERNIEH